MAPYNKWFENRIYPTSEGISIFFHDITERKFNEAKLRKSEELLNQAQQIAHVGYWEWDIKENTVQWSRELYNVYGKDPATFKPDLESYLSLIHPDEKEFIKRTVLNAVCLNQEYSYYQRIVRTDGEIRYLKSSGITEVNREGEVVRLIGVCHDITDLKLAEMEIKKLNTELETKIEERTKDLVTINKDLEAFTYSVSHDLRAPLRNINVFAKTIEDKIIDKIDDEGKDLLKMISFYASKMDKLILDLLAFSKLGKKEIVKSDIDMNELVVPVFNEVAKELDCSHVEKIIHKMPPCKGDYSLLSQVYYNLISNAVKYSCKKENPRVELGSELKDGEVVYYVLDNGIGFDMSKVNLLFGVFKRLNNAAAFPGTGLGLAIVARIINKHGGKVWAEGAIDKGAKFYFSLPK